MDKLELVRYRQGGAQNWVFKDLKGVDKSVNLCSVCRHYTPDYSSVHCPRATILAALRKAFGMVTVVWGCDLFHPLNTQAGKGGSDVIDG